MERIFRRVSFMLCVVLSFITGAECANPDVVGLAVSGSVAFLLLFLVVFYIAVSFNWSGWMKNTMRNKGKVKMPRAYWKKKEEAKRRLLSASASHASASVVNGQPPAATVDRAENAKARASWVQGWSQRSNVYNEVYEEKDVTLDLGEEQDDEYRIETTVVDNEVLDVGPYKSSRENEQPIDGDIYPEPYIYSTVEKASIKRKEDGAEPVASTSSAGEIRGDKPVSEGADVTKLEDITKFEDMLVKL